MLGWFAGIDIVLINIVILHSTADKPIDLDGSASQMSLTVVTYWLYVNIMCLISFICEHYVPDQLRKPSLTVIIQFCAVIVNNNNRHK